MDLLYLTIIPLIVRVISFVLADHVLISFICYPLEIHRLDDPPLPQVCGTV